MPGKKEPNRARGLLAGALLGLCALGAGAQGARAQIGMFRTSADSFSPAVSSRDLDRYGGLLGLDVAQKEAAKSLLEAYRTEFDTIAKDTREKTRAIRDEFADSHDVSVMEQMGPIMEKFTKRSKELEGTLLDDLRALLSEPQAARWPKLERTRRREKTIGRGTLSGESVDLVKVVEDLELTPEARQALVEPLEQYEAEIDRTLIERNKVVEEQMSQFAAPPGAGGRGAVSIDMDKLQEYMKKVREAGEKVRDVNVRYTRVIEPQLPQDKVKQFQLAVKKQSFPQVFRTSRAQRSLEAAMKFEDLDQRQKEAVASLLETYQRDASTLNNKWADALVEEEKSGAGPMSLGGGGTVMIMGDNENNGPVAEAKTARRDLDKKALDGLDALLTDAQKERLPKGGDPAGDGIGGALQVIRQR
jgi:flagellar biosynthesis/type III secretory pathway chaperone